MHISIHRNSLLIKYNMPCNWSDLFIIVIDKTVKEKLHSSYSKAKSSLDHSLFKKYFIKYTYTMKAL